MPAVNALHRIVLHGKPQIMFLQETKLHQAEMERVRMKLKFKGMLAVDCEGDGRRRRGGIGLFWREECSVSIQSFSLNHIDALIKIDGGQEWRFTGIYGHPETDNKRKTGELLKRLKRDDEMPWVCGGDFNLMLWSAEMQGGGEFKYEEADILWSVMDYSSLEDLHFQGHPYTWTNNQRGDDNLQERLDRFLANEQWKEVYGSSYVIHLEKRRSDHLPILLSMRTSMNEGQKKRYKKLFRFEEMWTREDECGDVIAAAWEKGEGVTGNLGRTKNELRKWSQTRFGDFAKEMRACRQQMGALMEDEPTHANIQKMRELDHRMDELEAREEIYWKQRSRQEWLQHGDKNTKFFHTKANQRERRNSIKKIQDAAGVIHEEEEDIAEVFVRHFQNLFCANSDTDMGPVLDKVQRSLSDEMSRILEEPYKGEEISEALKQMHPTKAPGPDGMCALFYQRYWSTIGEDVVATVLHILNDGGNIGSINQTYIALIPKKKECESPVDFRPISLCNVLYKIISKVLANRLKRVLPSVIHESQSGFVPGRLITDNILIAYECFHYLRKKKTGMEGYLGLKLDMSKAYDRVEWGFLEEMMLKMGFPESYVSLLLKCVRSTSFSILVNGQPTRQFYPTRGLRQGDPLSPFLFIICAEGLSSLLRDAEAKKEIHGIKIGKKVNAISHLFFADDSLLFTRANEQEVEKVLEILSTYEAASGQKLNMEKSEVSFSRNIEQEKQDLLQMKLSFKAVKGKGKISWFTNFC